MSRRHFTGSMPMLAASICFLAATSAQLSDAVVAQSTSITGKIFDTSRQPLPGVSITTVEATTGIVRSATSGGDGGYRFDALPDGTYRIVFELRGFDALSWNNLTVIAGTTSNADAMLPLSAICECVSPPRTELRELAGQVVGESGRPLPWARLEIAAPTGREVARADREGRFRVRVPIGESWPLTASDDGFSAVTRQVSGTVAEPLVFTLPRVGTSSAPYSERLARGCRCPGDLFVHPDR